MHSLSSVPKWDVYCYQILVRADFPAFSRISAEFGEDVFSLSLSSFVLMVDIRFGLRGKDSALPRFWINISLYFMAYFYLLFHGITQVEGLKWRGEMRNFPVIWASMIQYKYGYNFGSLTLSGQGAKHVLLDGNKNKSLDKNAVINTIDCKSWNRSPWSSIYTPFPLD